MTTSAAADVSFVIPVYNKRPFLAGMVEGLARQRGDFRREFIFVDDGSTDGSRAVLDRLTAGWPELRIISQRNCGPSIATNRGIAASRYPLIKPVDADDVLLPDATALLREALLQHPGAVLSFGAGEAVASDEAVARLRQAAPTTAAPATVYDALPALLRNCAFGPSACLIRTEIARQVGGCDERVFTQDYSLFLRLAAAGRFVRVGASLVLSPLVVEGRVNDGGPQVLHDINLALFHFLSEHPVPPPVLRATVRRGVKRAWRWATRREDVGLFNAPLWLLLRAYLSFPSVSLDLLRQSCAAFAVSGPVRLL
jgi:glycosyltransferase involved in cell wall biosynthesis